MKHVYPGEYIEATVSYIDIYILKKEPEIIPDYEEFFPVNTFLAPLEADCPYLTSKDAGFRFACNANHRLSQFIMTNREALKKQVPGIFYEILSSLARDSDDALISHINNLLTCLSGMPGGLFDVPTDLYLSGKDLYP